MATFLVLMLILTQLGPVTIAIATADTGATLKGPPRDRAALLSFMSGVTADPGRALANWGSPDTHMCNWTGIRCHRTKQRVVQLDLSGRDLHGHISPVVLNLSFLAVLDLSGNFFTGSIPAEIGALSRLKQLSLARNLLNGSIPAELGFLQELFYLDLGGGVRFG